MSDNEEKTVISKEVAQKNTQQQGAPFHFIRTAGLALLCMVFGFFGAWGALASGIVDQTTSITERRNIVTQEGELVAEVAKEISPSVVSIVVESETSIGLRTFAQESAGTGIVISKDGYILTNRHVIEDANSLSVVLSDGTSYEDVSLVGLDPANDIGFLKINGVDNLTPAKLGDSSEVQVGGKVIAVGNALGQYQTSVTSGIISGLGRPIIAGDASGADSLSNLFQTDAAINPGNSGGPLVNLRGEVIGINTAVDQEGEGIGFAIPINDAKGLIKSVNESGKVSRAFLGVSYVMLSPEVAKQYDLDTQDGALITASTAGGSAVTANSPAERAGLRDGDIIVSISGKKLGATNTLLSALSQYAPGTTVKIEYLRGNDKSTADVKLEDFPAAAVR